MRKLMFFRIAAGSILMGGTLAVVISAQSGATPAVSPSSSDALLIEIRALRADLNQRLDAGLRAQLLVARLQVQEQRISTLSRQITEIQQQLQTNERVRSPLEAQLKTFEAAHANASEAEKKDGDFMLDTLRSQIKSMAKSDEELQRQHLYLSGVIAEEQSRWTAFNARLEELEQLLTASPVPRR
jgi:septal ring factor EnvC (AmiA/AmiB activator)